MLRRPHGDRSINEIKNRKETGRWPHSDLMIVAVATSLPWGRRKGAVRPPEGRREADVRFSRHPRQGKNRMPPHGHRKATVPPPYGDLTAWLRCCGIVVSEKKFNVKLKKTQGLRWPCGVLKTVRSPYGLYKNRKAAVRFGGLRSPHSRRKHAASYMWPWHYRYRNPHYKAETVWRLFQVYNGNPYTNKRVS